MIVGSHVISSGDTFETVQVQLPLEGLDPGVAEVLGEHLSDEPVLVEYFERGPIADPANDLRVFMLEDSVELRGEGTHSYIMVTVPQGCGLDK